MKQRLFFILTGGAACICMLLLVAPTFAANVVIGGDYTDVGTIVIISPKPGDSALSNGTALLSILAGITADADNPYLIKLGPGTYHLGSTSLQMKQYVSIEGSGEEATTITASVSSSDPDTAAVRGVNNAGLRLLKVENTGTGTSTVAILNSSASPSIIHVTAFASGGAGNYGVYNLSSSPTMMNVTASASGGGTSYGVYNDTSSPMMMNVTASASGGKYHLGVDNNVSSPMMMNVTASASGGDSNFAISNNASSPTMMNVTASASGGLSSNYGVLNIFSSAPPMTNVTASASGGDSNFAISNRASSPTMTNVTASASGGSYNCGVNTSHGGTVKINHSVIMGTTNSIYNGSGVITRIGNTQLDGVAVNSGTVTCVGLYDGNYAKITDIGGTACQ